MSRTEAAHIAYAAVQVGYPSPQHVVADIRTQARFAISAKSRWAEKDSHFNYRKFYYGVLDFIEDCKDTEWKADLLKHFNV